MHSFSEAVNYTIKNTSANHCKGEDLPQRPKVDETRDDREWQRAAIARLEHGMGSYYNHVWDKLQH